MEYLIVFTLIIGAGIGGWRWWMYTTKPSKGCEDCDKDCPCKRL